MSLLLLCISCCVLGAKAFLTTTTIVISRQENVVKSVESFDLERLQTHVVDGIECREIVIEIPVVGNVTILEATAESQDDLVNLALDEDSPNISASLNAGDPYGAVLWPAASAIASYMLTNISSFEGLSVLELGTGTGLVSLAASLGGASSIVATDYEQIPLQLLEYAANKLNPRRKTPITTQLLDLHEFDKMPLPDADLVVAADIMYEQNTARALARRSVQALSRGSRVLVGDSPGRAGRPAFLHELHRFGVSGKFVPTKGWTCCGPRHDLICGKNSASVSETRQELIVDILDLDPATCFQ